MTRLTAARTREISIFVLLGVLFPATGYAYLDPETGTYGFQMVLAVGLVLFFSARAYWKKRRAKTHETRGGSAAGEGGEVVQATEESPNP